MLLQLRYNLEAVQLLVRGGELIVLAPRHLVDDLAPQLLVDLGVGELRDHSLRYATVEASTRLVEYGLIIREVSSFT